jgi:hypothetical protein
LPCRVSATTPPTPEPETLRRIVEAFRRGGEGEPLFMQVGLNWAPTEEEAVRAQEHWRTNLLGGEVNRVLRSTDPGGRIRSRRRQIRAGPLNVSCGE